MIIIVVLGLFGGAAARVLDYVGAVDLSWHSPDKMDAACAVRAAIQQRLGVQWNVPLWAPEIRIEKLAGEPTYQRYELHGHCLSGQDQRQRVFDAVVGYRHPGSNKAERQAWLEMDPFKRANYTRDPAHWQIESLTFTEIGYDTKFDLDRTYSP